MRDMGDIALVIYSALLWSLLDVSRKKLSQHLSPPAAVVWLSLGSLPFFLAWAVADGEWIQDSSYVLVGGPIVLLQLLANVLFIQAVQISPLSLTVPFLSLTSVFSAGFAFLALQEHLVPVQWIGIGGVLFGSFFLREGLRKKAHSSRLEVGGVLMIVVALIWSVTSALDKVALRSASVPAHALIQTVGVGAISLLWLVVRGNLRELASVRQIWKVFAFAVVALTAAQALQLLAIRSVPVGLVESLKRGLGLLASVLLGRLVFAEELTRAKLTAAVFMGLGSALLILG
ncbi:MAG: DMT family transporter [Myxococcota bacterium]